MMDINVYCDEPSGKLPHFWRSTGFTPANLLLDADMRQAIAFQASVPRKGIQYARVHYLLELVSAQGLGSETPGYDWSALDAALDVLVRNGVTPIFELMGNVEGYFNDFTDPLQAHAWRRLVRDLARHLVERYGDAEVSTWLFETWNEPDIGYWTQSEEAFCIYYDACSEGLREVGDFILGGPGTCMGLSNMLKIFLAHCDQGDNAFTKEHSVRLDFISVHVKGQKASPEDLTPDTGAILRQETRIIEYIRAHHPKLAKVPFWNDECDPQVGWADFHTWHGRAYYAAIVTRIIDQHLTALIDGLGVSYGLLSNDNGFLGQWGQRTLLARFGPLDYVDKGQAGEERAEPRRSENESRRRFAFIQKPVFHAMTLLSLLGEQRCKTALSGAPRNAGVGVIAARSNEGPLAVLVYHSRDEIMMSGGEKVRLTLHNPPFERAVLAHYRIDEGHTDPFNTWEKMGAPREPTAQQLSALRAAADLEILEEPGVVEARGGKLELAFDLPLPSVSLLLFAPRPQNPPAQVQGLRLEHYEGLDGKGETLVCWQGAESRAIRTYEVLYAWRPGAIFERINARDLLTSAFVMSPAAGEDGRFKVRAVDWWGRTGEESPEVSVR